LLLQLIYVERFERRKNSLFETLLGGFRLPI